VGRTVSVVPVRWRRHPRKRVGWVEAFKMAFEAVDAHSTYVNFGILVGVPLGFWWSIAGIPQPEHGQGTP
jgi:hypothetical protein